MDQHISIKDLRPQLPKVVDKADQEMARYIITKHGQPTAVLLGYVDYLGLVETIIELSDPENVKEIQKGIRQIEKGQTVSLESVKKKLGIA